MTGQEINTSVNKMQRLAQTMRSRSDGIKTRVARERFYTNSGRTSSYPYRSDRTSFRNGVNYAMIEKSGSTASQPSHATIKESRRQP